MDGSSSRFTTGTEERAMPTDDWDPEPSRPGLVHRMISPQAGARPATLAFGLGIAAALAFVASLALEWARVTFTLGSGSFSVSPGDEYTAVASPGTAANVGQVYLIGMLALLGLLGAVIMRPELALRLRMAASGVGVGLLGLVVATVLQFPAQVISSAGALFSPTGAIDEMLSRATVAYQPGLAAAVAAILLCVAAIWLAARPAVRAAAAGVPAPPPAAHHYTVVDPPRAAGQVGRVDELSVSASEPLSGTTDPWARG
jgi:hypothetical protein